jgi:DNA repair exonuclease SbcCD ATPase subunit
VLTVCPELPEAEKYEGDWEDLSELGTSEEDEGLLHHMQVEIDRLWVELQEANIKITRLNEGVAQCNAKNEDLNAKVEYYEQRYGQYLQTDGRKQQPQQQGGGSCHAHEDETREMRGQTEQKEVLRVEIKAMEQSDECEKLQQQVSVLLAKLQWNEREAEGLQSDIVELKAKLQQKNGSQQRVDNKVTSQKGRRECEELIDERDELKAKLQHKIDEVDRLLEEVEDLKTLQQVEGECEEFHQQVQILKVKLQQRDAEIERLQREVDHMNALLQSRGMCAKCLQEMEAVKFKCCRKEEDEEPQHETQEQYEGIDVGKTLRDAEDTIRHQFEQMEDVRREYSVTLARLLVVNKHLEITYKEQEVLKSCSDMKGILEKELEDVKLNVIQDEEEIECLKSTLEQQDIDTSAKELELKLAQRQQEVESLRSNLVREEAEAETLKEIDEAADTVEEMRSKLQEKDGHIAGLKIHLQEIPSADGNFRKLLKGAESTMSLRNEEMEPTRRKKYEMKLKQCESEGNIQLEGHTEERTNGEREEEQAMRKQDAVIRELKEKFAKKNLKKYLHERDELHETAAMLQN